MPKRQHFKRTTSLEERLAAAAQALRAQAKLLPPCAERDQLLRRARHEETAAHLTEWLTSPADVSRRTKP
jgi:hypothetical protein